MSWIAVIVKRKWYFSYDLIRNKLLQLMLQLYYMALPQPVIAVYCNRFISIHLQLFELFVSYWFVSVTGISELTNETFGFVFALFNLNEFSITDCPNKLLLMESMNVEQSRHQKSLNENWRKKNLSSRGRTFIRELTMMLVFLLWKLILGLIRCQMPTFAARTICPSKALVATKRNLDTVSLYIWK